MGVYNCVKSLYTPVLLKSRGDIVAKLKKRADGRYQRRVTLPDGAKKMVYGKSEPEVNQKVKEIEKAFNQGVDIADNTTVSDWAVRWMQTYKQGLRAQTRASILRNYNNHIAGCLASIRVKDVRPLHCQSVMNDVSKFSEDLQRKVLNIMKQLFETAISNNIISVNPASHIRITPHSEKMVKIQYLNEEQQRSILQTEEPRAKAFVALCLYAGLRREEALGLLWTDIEDGCIHVRKSLTFPVNQPDDNRELKTKASNRIIPMPKELISILNATPKRGINIITNTSGGEMTLSAFRRMWAYAEKTVDFKVHPYMLRHSYASSLYRMHVDIKTAQYLMGHTDIKTTLNIYTHIENNEYSPATKKLREFSIININDYEKIGQVVNK